MFKVEVDSEIRLCLINRSFSKDLVRLVEENLEYLSQWLDWPRHCKTENDFDAFIQGVLHSYANGKSMICVIEYKKEVIGVCGLSEINDTLSCAKIGYWIAQNKQGKGIVTRVCQYLMFYAFDELKVHKVEIAAAVENRSSRVVCMRLGMKLEGIFTNKAKVGNKILDHAVYSTHNSQKTVLR